MLKLTPLDLKSLNRPFCMGEKKQKQRQTEKVIKEVPPRQAPMPGLFCGEILPTHWRPDSPNAM